MVSTPLELSERIIEYIENLLYQLPKVNSDLMLDNSLLAIGNTPFVKNSGSYF